MRCKRHYKYLKILLLNPRVFLLCVFEFYSKRLDDLRETSVLGLRRLEFVANGCNAALR